MESPFRDQANLCAEQAASTSLPNVIDRCPRSAMTERTARHKQLKQMVKRDPTRIVAVAMMS